MAHANHVHANFPTTLMGPFSVFVNISIQITLTPQIKWGGSLTLPKIIALQYFLLQCRISMPFPNFPPNSPISPQRKKIVPFRSKSKHEASISVAKPWIYTSKTCLLEEILFHRNIEAYNGLKNVVIMCHVETKQVLRLSPSGLSRQVTTHPISSAM